MNEVFNAPSATVGELRRRIAKWLTAAFAADHREGSPELDARLLVGHLLGCDAGTVVLRDEVRIDTEIEHGAFALARRRAEGVPVARILGEKEFWGLPFGLSGDTLIPRPDTETMVEVALAAIDGRGWRMKPLTLLDLGTGSGAILAALLSELPMATGLGIDRSEGAIRVAQSNCARLGLGDRACFLVGDWAGSLGGRFDVVVSNPPYIPSATIDALPVEVREHDPHIALDGGADGLSAYHALLDNLPLILAVQGFALLEVGIDQASIVCEMARQNGFATKTHRDLAGIDRVVSLAQNGEKIGLEIGGEPDTVRPP